MFFHYKVKASSFKKIYFYLFTFQELFLGTEHVYCFFRYNLSEIPECSVTEAHMHLLILLAIILSSYDILD